MLVGAMTVGTAVTISSNEMCEDDEAFTGSSSSEGVPMCLMLMIAITLIVGMLCGCVLSRAMRGTPVSVVVSGPTVTVSGKPIAGHPSDGSPGKSEKTDKKSKSPIPAPRADGAPRPQERQRECYKRSVLTQSMVTYKREWLQQRFHPLGQHDHGAWSD